MSASGQRICRLAEAAAAAPTGTHALRRLRELRHELEEFERQQVARALTTGESMSGVARALGISRQAAHSRFRELRAIARSDRGAQRPPTPEARLVAQYARREAPELGAAAVGPEHLLLGILRNGDERAAGALERAGMTLAAARSQLRAPGIRPGADLRAVLLDATREAAVRGNALVGVEDLLAGCLRDPSGAAPALLTALGVAPAAVAASIGATAPAV